jgi:glycosyltransferase involved in cell wall biosynthesis
VSSDERGLLIVVGRFSSAGGVRNRVSDLACSLARARRVTILTWEPLALPRRRLRADGVRIVTVPSLLAWDRDHATLPAAINTVVSVFTGVCAAVLGRRRWSVAYGMGLHPEGTVAALAAIGSREFVLTTWQVGPPGNAQRLQRSASRRVLVPLLGRARSIAPETSYGARELLELKLPAERLTVVEGGVDLDRFKPSGRVESEGSRRAVYAGRFDLRHKRLDLLLEAWRAAELPEWELMLVGGGVDELAVRRQAAGITGVRIVGWRSDVETLLSSADLFVLPTLTEGSPLGMLEGMGCGLPGIVSAIPELSSRRPAGVLLARNEIDAWVEALRMIDALGPERRRAAGREARAWVEAHGDAARAHPRWAELLS